MLPHFSCSFSSDGLSQAVVVDLTLTATSTQTMSGALGVAGRASFLRARQVRKSPLIPYTTVLPMAHRIWGSTTPRAWGLQLALGLVCWLVQLCTIPARRPTTDLLPRNLNILKLKAPTCRTPTARIMAKILMTCQPSLPYLVQPLNGRIHPPLNRAQLKKEKHTHSDSVRLVIQRMLADRAVLFASPLAHRLTTTRRLMSLFTKMVDVFVPNTNRLTRSRRPMIVFRLMSAPSKLFSFDALWVFRVHQKIAAVLLLPNLPIRLCWTLQAHNATSIVALMQPI